MKLILPCGDGAWFQLEPADTPDPRGADEINRASQTAVGYTALRSLQHPREDRYFIWKSTAEPAVHAVVLGIPPPGEGLPGFGDRHGPVVVGMRNADPFESHADKISALGLHLGVDLGPQTYPYERKPAAEPEEFQGA